MSHIVSIQVGAVRDVVLGESTRRTAYFKSPVESVHVTKSGLAGDEQAVPEVHGGPDRAVLAYAYEHYALWREEYRDHDFPPGAFAENLTVAGLDEQSVCIGDRYRARLKPVAKSHSRSCSVRGASPSRTPIRRAPPAAPLDSVLLEVSMPRTPCGTISQARGASDLFERVEASGRTGWLHRVLEEGVLEPRAELVLCARPHPRWSVARAAGVMAAARRHERALANDALELAEVAELAERWRVRLRERAEFSLREA